MLPRGTSDNVQSAPSVRRLFMNDPDTLSVAGLSAAVAGMAAVIAFNLAPIWPADPWIAGGAGLLLGALTTSPFMARRIRWLSLLSHEGVVLEAVRDGWGRLKPFGSDNVLERGMSLPRYAYTYRGTVHHVLWSNYFIREPPRRLRVLVDREHPERGVGLDAFADDPLPQSSIPPISSHIGPWLDRHAGIKGCGCSLVIVVIVTGVTGLGFGHSTIPDGPLLDALNVVGLAAPMIAVLHLLWRFATRRR